MVKNPPTPTGDTPCTPVQDETYNACHWYYLKQQHPDWTDQQITQAQYAGNNTFNQFMQDDRPVL